MKVEELKQIEPALRYFAWRVEPTGFWKGDLIQTGRLSYLQSRALGYSQSQSLRKAYFRVINDYFRNLKPGAEVKGIKFITNSELEKIINLDQDRLDVEGICELLESWKVLTVTDRLILKLLLSGEPQIDIARMFNVSPKVINTKIQGIRGRLTKLYQY